MIASPRLLVALACAGLLVSGRAGAQAPVTAPPEAFFGLVRKRDRDAARRFYGKYLDAGGIPVVAAPAVADAALGRAREIVTRVLAGRPDVAAALAQDGMYLVIIGADQVYTDIPEYRRHPDPAYVNERVRGTGGRPTSFGEENLLGLPLDRYDDESIAVHEFCHTVAGALRRVDPAWDRRLRDVYRAALDRGLWRDTYAASNPGEYWAEIAQAYFDCNRVNNWNHGPVGTREQLKQYDPEGYELARSTFRLTPERDWRYAFPTKLPAVTAPPARLGIDPYYTKFTWAREFTVVGREASDAALLAANDTVRKLFAYRHDVLKALIAAGVRLVVLGPGETLADLPELKGRAAPEFDPLARYLDYAPETRLVVVAEENVLGDPAAPRVGPDGVVRGLALALHRVAGTRPVDPTFDPRGPNVQQYELRVERLDERFDARLTALYDGAIGAGRWRGTSAAADRAAYWAAGVLAYFDAAGQDAAPPGAPHPIRTRESLERYDPGLHALVAETMAYRGHVDWRLAPHRP